MHNEPFCMSLSVWVPANNAIGGWRVCDLISPLMSDEMIRTCDEIRAVVGAQSRFAALVLSTPQAPVFAAFRLVGRDKETSELVGMAEWARSRETGELVQTSDVFTACQWEHGETRLAA